MRKNSPEPLKLNDIDPNGERNYAWMRRVEKAISRNGRVGIQEWMGGFSFAYGTDSDLGLPYYAFDFLNRDRKRTNYRLTFYQLTSDPDSCGVRVNGVTWLKCKVDDLNKIINKTLNQTIPYDL